MKKLIATLLSLSVVLTLASCGGDTDATSSAATSSAPVSSAAPSTPEAPTPSPVESKVEVSDPNKALSGTAFTSGNNDNSGGDQALNDGNMTTRWQGATTAPESEDNPSWFGIKWDSEQTFDKIVLTWEAAHPEEDGFYVETSEDGENWTKVEFSSERTGNANDEGVLEPDLQKDTVILDEALTTKFVRIYCFTHYVVPEGFEYAGNSKSPTSCYEMEIYNTAEETATTESATTESVEAAE